MTGIVLVLIGWAVYAAWAIHGARQLENARHRPYCPVCGNARWHWDGCPNIPK